MRAEEIAAQLTTMLPGVSLLLGPDVRELQRLAHQAVLHHRVHPADLIETARLTPESARALGQAAQLRTGSGLQIRVIVVNMASASDIAQSVLLKVLESGQPDVHWLLLSTSDPLPALMSRCAVFQLSGPGEPAAAGPAWTRVQAAVAAAQSGDPAALVQAVRDFDEECITALRGWAVRELCQESPVPEAELAALLQMLNGNALAQPVNLAVAALSTAFMLGR